MMSRDQSQGSLILGAHSLIRGKLLIWHLPQVIHTLSLPGLLVLFSSLSNNRILLSPLYASGLPELAQLHSDRVGFIFWDCFLGVVFL